MSVAVVADPHRLQLSQSERTQDVLVQYDEGWEANDRIWRRAYWLGQNAHRIANGRRPLFVSTAPAKGLVAIPVFCRTNLPADPAAGLYALVSTNGQEFRLCLPGKEPTEHALPVYTDASGRVKQVLLTPLTVIADATIVGGVIAYLALASKAGDEAAK